MSAHRVFARRILRRRGIEIILNDRLKAATSERAILQSGIEIPCKTLISTVPSALPPIAQNLDCPKERGKLLVNAGLELKDYDYKGRAIDVKQVGRELSVRYVVEGSLRKASNPSFLAKRISSIADFKFVMERSETGLLTPSPRIQ